MKKTLALTLALIMVLCMLPSVALAVEALNTGYGTFSYEKGKWNVDVTLEIYLDGEKVFNQTQEIQRAAASASFKASEGYFIEKVEINKGTWGVNPHSPKSKEYSGVLTLRKDSTIKLHLVKSCKLTVEYQYTDKSAGNSDIKKYQGYTKEVYPGEEFKSNEWNYYDAEGVREYYTSSVKDGNGNNVDVKGTPIKRYFNGTITKDATYTVTFAPANTNDFFEINSYEGSGIIGNMNANFRYYGYKISGENGTDKVYIVEDGKLTADALKNEGKTDPGTIIKGGKTYKYVFAGLGVDLTRIKDVYYDSSEQNWYYAYEGSAPIPIPVREQGRINFVYKETTNSHILNYDANGGEGTFDVQSYGPTTDASHEFTIHDGEPTREGYDFLGWADDANATATEAQYMPGDRITVSGEKTIYAVWKSKEVQTRDITLTYSGNADDAVANVPDAVTKQISTTEPSATFDISADQPTREGYEFLGWSQNPGATKPDTFTNNQIVAPGNVTLYAVWKENKPEQETTGTLIVIKTVTGNEGDKNQYFTFTVTLKMPEITVDALAAPITNATPDTSAAPTPVTETYGGVTFTDGVATFTLKHNESKTIKDIPAGYTYTVTESGNDGYTVTKTGDTGTIVGGKTVTAAFTNDKQSSATPTPGGGNGGGHYHTTTTPVPVIVIPPKTGDMTVWQSILHFLGIR